MAVAKTCIRCNRKFLAKKDEQYCKQCAKDELMAILNKPKEEPPKEVKEVKVQTKCKRCGKSFEQTGKGRPAVNCPTCRAELSEPKQKALPKDNQSKKVNESTSVISKKETTMKDIIIKKDDIKDISVTTDIKPMSISNMVDHPAHYNKGKIEVIDFIEDQQLPFHLGNVVKYVARAGYKGDKLEDLKKARWYLDRYINEVMK